MSYIFSAWMYACGGEGGAGVKGQRRDARRERGNPSKISPANGRAEPREASGGARARTGSPSPPRMGAEVLKLRTGAVRARCVSARRAALTRALDMLPRAAKSGRLDAGGALVRIFWWNVSAKIQITNSRTNCS